MAFKVEDLVFSLEVKATQAVLQLDDNVQEPFEAAFDCGRTNVTPGQLVVNQPDLEQLKAALRKALEALEQ